MRVLLNINMVFRLVPILAHCRYILLGCRVGVEHLSGRGTTRANAGSSIGPALDRHAGGHPAPSLTGLRDLPSYISGTAETLGVYTPQPPTHHSRGSPILTKASVKDKHMSAISSHLTSSKNEIKKRTFTNTLATTTWGGVSATSTIRTAMAGQHSFNPKSSLRAHGSGPLLNITKETKHSSQTEKQYLLPHEIADLEQKLADAKFEDFIQQTLLGKGAYASTYLGIHNQTRLGVAIKLYQFSEKNMLKDSIDSEIAILKKLSHANIVRLYQHYEMSKKTILVLE